MFVLRLFNRRWILTTLLVIAAVAVMARLGIWQLDRLEQRRAFNTRVLAQIDQPPLELSGEAVKADVYNMEYRQVSVTGEYDHSQEIAIRNQAYDGQWGVHLVTPLKISRSDAIVLVDRGWIPAEDYQNGDWSKFIEPGRVTVHGVIRRSQERPDFGPRRDPTPAPGDPPQKTWNFVNVDALNKQISGTLLPIYVQKAPDPDRNGYPVGSEPDIEITEGSHMGYAIQWFFFASLLFFGYPFFVRKQEEERHRQAGSGKQVDDGAINGAREIRG